MGEGEREEVGEGGREEEVGEGGREEEVGEGGREEEVGEGGREEEVGEGGREEEVGEGGREEEVGEGGGREVLFAHCVYLRRSINMCLVFFKVFYFYFSSFFPSSLPHPFFTLSVLGPTLIREGGLPSLPTAGLTTPKP